MDFRVKKFRKHLVDFCLWPAYFVRRTRPCWTYEHQLADRIAKLRDSAIERKERTKQYCGNYRCKAKLYCLFVLKSL